jgi:hypothetical protein
VIGGGVPPAVRAAQGAQLVTFEAPATLRVIPAQRRAADHNVGATRAAAKPPHSPSTRDAWHTFQDRQPPDDTASHVNGQRGCHG